MDSEINELSSGSSYSSGWFSWTKPSSQIFHNAEKRLLSCVKTTYRSFFVKIGKVVSDNDEIWTISLNEQSQKTPLVLMHGLASGLALWSPNLDGLAAERPVYAIDVLGFARSSRPTFSKDPDEVEAQWVESVEQWRHQLDVPKMALCGHSLGGYLAAAYALKYPQRVEKLILADPWGFLPRPEVSVAPLWFRAIVTCLRPFNLSPLWPLRTAGPYGRTLFARVRGDIIRKYQRYLDDADEVVPDYVYQCNVLKPSGEAAFKSLTDGTAYARSPMLSRIHVLDRSVPLTVINGSNSWVRTPTAEQMYELRPENTLVQVIEGATHHIYLDEPEQFNRLIADACDKDGPIKATISTSTAQTSGNEKNMSNNKTEDTISPQVIVS